MQGGKGDVQGGLEVVEQFFGHLRDVFLESVGRVQVDGANLAQALEQLAVDLGHPRCRLARAQ